MGIESRIELWWTWHLLPRTELETICNWYHIVVENIYLSNKKYSRGEDLLLYVRSGQEDTSHPTSVNKVTRSMSISQRHLAFRKIRVTSSRVKKQPKQIPTDRYPNLSQSFKKTWRLMGRSFEKLPMQILACLTAFRSSSHTCVVFDTFKGVYRHFNDLWRSSLGDGVLVLRGERARMMYVILICSSCESHARKRLCLTDTSYIASVVKV